jgi:ABC-type proline/glycine betaine transport system ATPase subunit
MLVVEYLHPFSCQNEPYVFLIAKVVGAENQAFVTNDQEETMTRSDTILFMNGGTTEQIGIRQELPVKKTFNSMFEMY